MSGNDDNGQPGDAINRIVYNLRAGGGNAASGNSQSDLFRDVQDDRALFTDNNVPNGPSTSAVAAAQDEKLGGV